MNCLNGIVGIKDYCNPAPGGTYVSEYVDVSNILFSHLASDDELTGKQYAEELIKGAEEQVWADANLAMSEGYSIVGIAYHYNNTCRFIDTYTNQGIMLTSFFRSANSLLNVSSVRTKSEVAGPFVLVIDDGLTLKEFNIVGTEKQEVVTNIEYSTNQRFIRIYPKDENVKLALLSCPASGCGSCASKRGIFIQQTGWNRVASSSQASGIIANAFISCDLSGVICNVIAQHKSLFQKAIAYKVGEMAYNRLLLSPRMNDSTLNIDHDAARVYLNTLVGKYRELVFGSAQAYGNAATKGIVQLMRMSMKNMNDACVICDAQIKSSTAIF
jgi:hypothetical protein